MPRLRALTLLALFVVNQAACTSWQVPKVTPEEYAKQSSGDAIRITPKDGQGNSQRTVVLTRVYFARDTVFGSDPQGHRIAFSLHQVAGLEVRRADGVATGFLLVALAASITAGVAGMKAFGDALSCISICN